MRQVIFKERRSELHKVWLGWGGWEKGILLRVRVCS
jgi:hypothetical protein